MDTIIFCSDATLSRKTTQYRLSLLLTACVFLAANLFCLRLLIGVEPKTEKEYTLTACIVSGAGAVLTAILFWNLVLPLRRQIRHNKMLLEETRERIVFDKGLQVSNEAEQIPGSVKVLRVSVPGGRQETRLFISKEGAKQLRASSIQSGVLEAVNGFIVSLTPGREKDR